MYANKNWIPASMYASIIDTYMHQVDSFIIVIRQLGLISLEADQRITVRRVRRLIEQRLKAIGYE